MFHTVPGFCGATSSTVISPSHPGLRRGTVTSFFGVGIQSSTTLN
jgi:hypothetical protein